MSRSKQINELYIDDVETITLSAMDIIRTELIDRHVIIEINGDIWKDIYNTIFEKIKTYTRKERLYKE